MSLSNSDMLSSSSDHPISRSPDHPICEANATIQTVLKRALSIAVLLAGAAQAQQQASPTPQPSPTQPQMKVNYLNVCAPGKEEQEIINGALAFVQGKPAFSSDFEISRGRTTLKDAPEAKFVRLRRDFAADSPLATAQYSMSTDTTNTVEILVLHPRDPKDFLEIVMEARVAAGAATPASVVAVDTPAMRVRIERLNKSSAALTRCPEADQSTYEPVFRQASETMARYRAALGLRTMFRSDIAWLNPTPKNTGAAHKPKPPAVKP